MKPEASTIRFDTGSALGTEEALPSPWWLYPTLCSLDAPVVAVVWLGGFSRAFESPVALSVYAVLFLTVWAIYIADRLVDSLRLKNWQVAAARHRFVRRHQRAFAAVLVMILPLAATLSLVALPLDLLVAGLALCGVVGLYFAAFVRVFPGLKPLRAKEFACGFVFAGGTALGVDGVRRGIFTQPAQVLPAILLFAGLCIFNCLIIAARERHIDQANDPGAASLWWRHLDRDLLVFGVALMAASGFAWMWGDPAYLYPACFISAAALTGVHFFHHRFSVPTTRVLVDAVLLSPLLLLL
jgi:hypothetical protein